MVKIQAHRGFSDNYPENTMLSFQKSYEEGIFGIETDVHKTLDGKYVLIHDYTVNRTTNGSGVVKDLTHDYIKSLDAGGWFDSKYAGRVDCKVPTLIEFLDTYKGKDITLILHIYLYDVEDIQAIVDMVVTRGMINQVHFFGEHAMINSAKAYNPNIFTLNSSGKFINNYQADLDNAIRNGHNAVSVNVDNPLNDLKTMVNNIHSHGKLVHVSYLYGSYTLGMRRMVEAGVDFVLGNNPQLMQNYINSSTPIDPTPDPNEPTASIIHVGNYIKTVEGNIKTIPYIKTVDGFIRCKSFVGSS